VADDPAVSAQADLTAAYLDAAGRNVSPIAVAGDLSGQTLTPGLYNSTSPLGLTGTLILNGASNSVFIFQIASSLTTGTGSSVVLTGGVTAANIFWQVGSSATLGTYSTFNGTILAQASISILTGAVLNGRALAETGAVTLDSNAMANPGPPITAAPPPPLAVTCPVGTAQAGVAYNSLLAATGGTPPYTFSITGSPPLGLSLVVATGLLTGTPTAAGSFSFTTNALDSASVNATNNTCSITVAAAAADVSIVKSGPATVATSTNIIYDLAVANAGPSLAAGVTVSDTLPAGTTFVSATPSQGSCTGTSTVSCSLGTVPASGVATVQLVVKSPGTSGTVANTATVAADTPDPNSANNTSTASVKVTATPSIPTLSTWGVALLALLLLLTGCSRGSARA
jgi:type VI secretion system secreted protein VgrG